MSFDPDAYLAAHAQPKGAFDPDAYLAANKPKEIPKLSLPPSNWVNIARSGLQGATMGWSDEAGTQVAADVASLVRPLTKYAPNAMAQYMPADTGETNNQIYRGMQSQVNDEQNQFRQDNPVTSALTEIGGAVLPIIASGGTAAPASTLGLGGKMLAGAGIGAAQGGLYGAGTAEEDKRLEGAKQGAEIGGVTGGIFPMIPAALGKVISPDSSKNAALQKVLSEGGKPTIGMALGGRANAVEEELTSIPILGDMISVARNKAVKSLEPAAYNRALNPIGETLPKGLSGRDAIVHTENVLKQKYSNVLDKIGAITPDEQFATKAQSLQNMVDNLQMPQAQKDKFIFALDKVRSSIDENGVMTSEGYKKLESSLGSQAKKLYSSQDIYEAEMAPAVKQLQQELRDMLSRKSGKYSKELKSANEGWANFKVLQKAASGVGAEEGSFSPTQLQSAVRAADSSKDKAAYARGNALMQDLSEAGKKVMGNKTGNSFTADRGFLAAGALGTGMASPVIPASLAAGGLMYTQPIQNALVSAVAKRGVNAAKNSKAAQNALTRAAPAAVLLANRNSQNVSK